MLPPQNTQLTILLSARKDHIIFDRLVEGIVVNNGELTPSCSAIQLLGCFCYDDLKPFKLEYLSAIGSML